MEQGNAATAVVERPVDTSPSSVQVQLRAALEQELAADARDPRTDADGALMFTDT
jgi:hypothetical protein